MSTEAKPGRPRLSNSQLSVTICTRLPTAVAEVIDQTQLSRAEFVRVAIEEKLMTIASTAAVYCHITSPGSFQLEFAEPNPTDPFWNEGLRAHVQDRFRHVGEMSGLGFALVAVHPTIRVNYPTNWSKSELQLKLEARAGIAKVKVTP